MYLFLGGLGLLVVVGLHQLLESRKVSIDGCFLDFTALPEVTLVIDHDFVQTGHLP